MHHLTKSNNKSPSNKLLFQYIKYKYGKDLGLFDDRLDLLEKNWIPNKFPNQVYFRLPPCRIYFTNQRPKFDDEQE